jgi:hypothetical protein
MSSGVASGRWCGGFGPVYVRDVSTDASSLLGAEDRTTPAIPVYVDPMVGLAVVRGDRRERARERRAEELESLAQDPLLAKPSIRNSMLSVWAERRRMCFGVRGVTVSWCFRRNFRPSSSGCRSGRLGLPAAGNRHVRPRGSPLDSPRCTCCPTPRDSRARMWGAYRRCRSSSSGACRAGSVPARGRERRCCR